MYSALVIGCGNIGALYDLTNDQILTHAKAFSLSKEFSLSVFDIDKEVTKNVSSKYNCNVIDNIDKKALAGFDCVSICTPTSTHVDILEKALKAGVKVIICEKPVSNIPEELNKALSMYSSGDSKVIVNYIRRFQPAYSEVKKLISGILMRETLTNISIRYQKGFLNNCSHAFDLIEFLINDRHVLNEIKKHHCVYDHFADDPTISLQAFCNGANVSVTGLTEIKYPVFEIDLFFTEHKIAIYEAGNKIKIFGAVNSGSAQKFVQEDTKFRFTDCVKNYMQHVVGYVEGILKGEELNDNFLSSVELNERMIRYIKI